MSAVRCFFMCQALLLGSATLVFGQNASPRARVVVTVTDPSTAVVPTAEVRLVGLDAQTRATTIPPVKTNDRGVATFENLAPGMYSILAELTGFELGLLRDIRLVAGDNRRVVILPLKGVSEVVSVTQDTQAAASDRRSGAFGQTLTAGEIQALSDDPAELQRQLMELGGPDAVIRIDSFEGQGLPPKSMIKSVHVTRDQFAAETELPGSVFVDIITQAGVGPFRGNANVSFRDGSMSARSPFVSTRGPEQIRRFGTTIGGTLIPERLDVSLSVAGTSQFITPVLNVVLPDGTRSETLNIRQPGDGAVIDVLLNWAPTREQTVRAAVGFERSGTRNLGVGAYDLIERAFERHSTSFSLRLLEAGPIGRRFFVNTRLSVNRAHGWSRSVVEAPTVVVQDAFSSGGAQTAGDTRSWNVMLATDVDYIRGIHSWRTGGVFYGNWFDTDARLNYLGTYTFSSPEAFELGQPLLYTRQIGDPHIRYFNAQGGGYLQDDIRVRRGLTLSPGIRYSRQRDIDDPFAFEPRFGMTWAPSQSGQTTLRISGGIFHGWLPTSVYEQTVRFDGQHQRELVISNPSYPDPGDAGTAVPSNLYRIGDYKLQQNFRYAGGVDHAFSPRVRANFLYTYLRQKHQPRGKNVNAPVDGVRPRPDVANIIETTTDAEIRRHDFSAGITIMLVPPGPAANTPINWRRLTFRGSFSPTQARSNANGPFGVPPSGTLATEWGPGAQDNPYRLALSLTSTQIRNLNVAVTWGASDGAVYSETTGLDNNLDGIVTDRPIGVGLRSLRGTDLSTVSMNVAYSWIPASGAGRPPSRFRLGVSASVNNLTNHTNYGGFSGVIASPNYLRPTNVVNPRKVDLAMTLGF